MTLQERIEQISAVWPQLPEHIRLAVEALCLTYPQILYHS